MTRLRQISVDLSMVTRVGRCSTETADTVSHTAVRVSSPEPSSARPGVETRVLGAESRGAGSRGSESRASSTLHTPGIITCGQ